jgi:hypothetical protein
MMWTSQVDSCILSVPSLLQAVFMVGFSSDADKLFADANQTASEAFNNIRTVCYPQLQCHVPPVVGLYHTQFRAASRSSPCKHAAVSMRGRMLHRTAAAA